MMRRGMLALTAAAALGCAATESPPTTGGGAKRTTLVPAPGAYGFNVARDGRLAYSGFIESKAAVFVADAAGRNPKRRSFGVWDVGPVWSPDGKWIAFDRDAGGQFDVLIVPADSGAERVVAGSAVDEIRVAWLPDGSGLIISRNAPGGRELWVYQLADGRTGKLFTVDGSAYGCPSPDGKWIAYSLSKDGKSTVWLWDRAKKAHRQLTTEGFEYLSYGCFSPDSRSILYRSTRTGTSDLWRLDAASGERRQLTQDIAEDGNGMWSADGTHVVFRSNRGGQWDLWMLGAGEQDVQRVTDDAVTEEGAEWTPDGRGIVASVGVGLAHLYAVPLSGGAPVALTSGAWLVNDAQVSRDGSRIAYSGSKNGDEDIWVVPATGGESHLVSGAPGFDGAVAWSPDGKQLSFSSRRAGNPDIWIAPEDGGAATPLTAWPSAESASRWSPDGKTIAFLSSRESPGVDIWTMPVSGGTPTRVTKVGTIGSYRWSPDGKSIAFGAQIDSSGSVFVVPATGGTPKRIAPPTSLNPEWSPDGREIKVMQCDKGYCTTEIHALDGTHLRTLTTRANAYEFDARWSHSGSQVLINWQDILGDGGNRLDLRPTAGGAGRTLTGPPGFTLAGVGFTAGDSAVIMSGGPLGNAVQRIDVAGAVQASRP
jgi:Tol biopolymer transport system component